MTQSNFLAIAVALLLAGAVYGETEKINDPPPYPLEGKIEKILKQLPPENRKADKAKSANEVLYLALSEPIVRQAIAWQDKSGRIIDPFVSRETPTATPRFVGALAGLIMKGRCLDLTDNGRRALTAATEDLFAAGEKPLAGAEFYTKELMLGFLALADKTDSQTVERWKRLLGSFDPEKNYGEVLGKRPAGDLYNFCTFGLAGEGMKRKYGLAANDSFIERHIATQIPRFEPFGMYRDPNCPMTYDAVPRMNLSLLFHSGYRGPYFPFFDEMLRRGALTMLLCLSPTGEAPYGGRSNQQNFNEATIALICESEASRYQKTGNRELAGAFKRTARVAVQSIRRWLDLKPVRFTKNEFPPESQHGRQKDYGFYSAYSQLIASQFGFAGWLADSGIAEGPAPYETGGYVIRLGDDFHKIFATCGGYHVEIDTRADLHYDATGLGRLHKAGVASETALSTPIVSDPDYLVSTSPSPRNVAIGPGWKRGGKIEWLSDMSQKIRSVDFRPLEENKSRVAFRVIYRGDPACGPITETYVLNRRGLEITCKIGGSPDGAYLQVPLIETDGNHRSRIEAGGRSFSVSYQGHVYRVKCLFPESAVARLETFTAPNRNGIYRVGVFSAKGNSITCHLDIE